MLPEQTYLLMFEEYRGAKEGKDFMRIRGKIFKKRPYPKLLYNNINCISFLEVEHGIQVEGDHIKIIPILSEESYVSPLVGEKVEIEGELKWRRIITSSGKLSFSPIPVFMLQDIKRVSSFAQSNDKYGFNA
ncbi:hypothetical protein [Neobacillus cucumis]|uniref:hypothetical protein n=1 Tax=Neobacillus cucumis TaxID=1740721 RepID=UPI002E23F462|nr:hypothetical protein [Neobacillus cucumis]